MDETANLTKWCLKSSAFNNFFKMAQDPDMNTFDYYVNFIMDDLSDGTC